MGRVRTDDVCFSFCQADPKYILPNTPVERYDGHNMDNDSHRIIGPYGPQMLKLPESLDNERIDGRTVIRMDESSQVLDLFLSLVTPAARRTAPRSTVEPFSSEFFL